MMEDDVMAHLQSPTAAAITTAVNRVRQRLADACQKAGRDPATVRLLPVTKTLPTAWGPILRQAGITTVGENRLDHCAELLTAEPGLSVEHIGRLQSRQLGKLPAQVTTIHALAEARHAVKLQRLAEEQQRSWRVYVQVNTSGEAQKAGVAAEYLPELLTIIQQQAPSLSVAGLMTMAPDPDLPEVSRQWVCDTFASCAELARQYGLPELSMGMSKDLEEAVAAGATVVRIGSDCWRGL